MGEAVKAIVELKAGKILSEQDIVDLCKENLSAYKAPKTVEMVDELPRSGVGKVLKRKLREKYWVGHERKI